MGLVGFSTVKYFHLVRTGHSSSRGLLVSALAVSERGGGNTLCRRENDGTLAPCVIDKQQIEQLLAWAHDGHGHYAATITLGRLRGQAWWPTRVSDIADYCKRCYVCQQAGPRLFRVWPRRFSAYRPMAMFGMGFMDPIEPPSAKGYR